MYREVKLRKAGGSSIVKVPKAMLERHRLEAGDRAYLVDTAEGILITPYDPTFAKAMAIAERGAKKYKHALHQLAK